MNLHVTNGASDRLPDEMISEYRVFSGNPFDLLTRRFVPTSIPGVVSLSGLVGAERVYQRFFCQLPAALSGSSGNIDRANTLK